MDGLGCWMLDVVLNIATLLKIAAGTIPNGVWAVAVMNFP